MDSISLSHSVDICGFDRFQEQGDFTVVSVRYFIDEKTIHSTSLETKWNKLVPIKFNVFAWRLDLDKLMTRGNLLSRGLDVPCLIFPICDSFI